MCGRFNVTATPGLEGLLRGLGYEGALPVPRVNLAPTEGVPLLRRGDAGNHHGQSRIDEARWWLTPHWAREPSQKYAMFNARCETAARSPAFRRPFASQRGIVPMSGFIEWRGSQGNRQPWLISNDTAALAVAALWDLWRGDNGAALLSCTVLTTEAAETFRPWHSRMPVLLAGDETERWLDNSVPVNTADPIFSPRLKETLLLVPLDRRVGNARNKSPELMAPVGDGVALAADAPGA
jgi:putative SOS response-associated peptidase YedK